MDKKYAVITFLFNNYDLLREPLVIDELADYYCITDDKSLCSEKWHIIYVNVFDTDELDGIQKTYMTKYSFYNYIPTNYEYYVTIDASLEICDKLFPIIEYMDDNNYNIGLSLHPIRSRWSDEYKVWIDERNLDKKYYDIFDEWATKMGYKSSDENGLIECTMKIYKNDDENIKFIDDVYNTLKETNNFKDKNDQCYFTCIYDRHKKKLNTMFFYQKLYSLSKYFKSYYHNSKNRWITDRTKDNNTNVLFGETIDLIEFDEEEPISNILDIFVTTYKMFKPLVNNDVYKIIDSRTVNNKNYILKDDFYSEILSYFYISENCKLKDYIGFCHYRKYWSFLDEIPDIDNLIKEYGVIAAKQIKFSKSIKEQYKLCHNIEDLYIISGILCEKYPNYVNIWNSFLNSDLMFPYNMFIMKSDEFLEYIKFIKTILDEYINIVGIDINKRINDNKEKYLKDFYPNSESWYQYRIGGYLAERLTNLWLLKNHNKISTLNIIVTEDKYKKEKE